MYTAYTTNTVFTDARFNATADFLFSKIAEAFPPDDLDPDNDYVFKGVILSGKAASILRGDTGEIRNVTLQTDKQDIYDWLVQNLGNNLFNCPQISFKNRILFYPQPDLYFEIWLSDTPLDGVLASGIYIQTLENIPPQTL